MKNKKLLIAVVLYLIGLSLTLSYSLTNEFTSYSDTAKEYELYQLYMKQPFKEVAAKYIDQYQLQISSLSTTYVPAKIAQKLPKSTHKLFFKVYVSILPPLIPVIVYLILNSWFVITISFTSSFLMMAQPAFLQAPSMARTNIAILLFSIIIWTLLKVASNKKRNIIVSLCSIAIIITHYSTAIIAIPILSGYLAYEAFKRNRALATSVILAIVTMAVAGALWYHYTSPNYLSPQAIASVIESSASVGISGNVSWFSLSLRDKITQAAFGVQSPDGDSMFKFSYLLLASAWLTITMIGTGLLQYKRLPMPVLSMATAGLAIIVATVLSPVLSRIYGIERTYYQASITLTPYFILGCHKASGLIRVKPIIVTSFVLLILLVLMKQYGVIHSLIR